MFRDPRMRFPVIARKFPVRLKKFPVPSLREFAKIIEQCQDITRKFEARSGCFCKNSLFFPCLTGNSAFRNQRTVRSGLPPPGARADPLPPVGRDLRTRPRPRKTAALSSPYTPPSCFHGVFPFALIWVEPGYAPWPGFTAAILSFPRDRGFQHLRALAKHTASRPGGKGG